MNRRSTVLFAAVLVALTGCDLTAMLQKASFQTPKEAPAPPERKPTPPSDFATWSGPSETVVPPDVGGAQPSAAVEVESLAPLGSDPVVATQQTKIRTPDAQPAAAQLAAYPADRAPAGNRAINGRYVVAKGDSLYGIARRSGLPLRAIIDANAMQPPYKLTLGQSLTIPQARAHVVAPGDTVFNISRRYGVDRSELVRLNGLEPPYAIPLGQTLILPQPGTGTRVTQIATAPQARPATKATPGSQSAAQPQAALGEPIAKPIPKPAAKSATRSTAPKPVVAKRGPVGKPPPRSKSTFLWPVQGPVLSSYGGKKDGVHNDGVNIAAPRGAPVRAAENGVVAYAGEELKGFGKLLLIKHADNWVTAYAHNEKLLVQQGDVVTRGQSVARVGSTGSVPRPQLHFEVRRGTRAVNPETMMGPRPTTAAKPG